MSDNPDFGGLHASTIRKPQGILGHYMAITTNKVGCSVNKIEKYCSNHYITLSPNASCTLFASDFGLISISIKSNGKGFPMAKWFSRDPL